MQVRPALPHTRSRLAVFSLQKCSLVNWISAETLTPMVIGTTQLTSQAKAGNMVPVWKQEPAGHAGYTPVEGQDAAAPNP